MLGKLLIIAGLVYTVVATSRVPSIAQRDVFQPVNPPDSVLPIPDTPPPFVVRKTNAERLAAGLPPLPPARSRTANPRSVPSNTPAGRVVQGYIQLTETGTGANYGYVRKNLNSYGEFGATTDPDQRLIVSVNLGGIEEGPSNVVVVNGASPHTHFGGIIGYSSTSSDLQSGSCDYAYLGQTEASQPNSPAVSVGNSFNDATGLSKAMESAIWTFDAFSETFSAQWVNSDRSSPTTYIGLINDVLILTGDENEFANNLGSTVWLTLNFVPIS